MKVTIVILAVVLIAGIFTYVLSRECEYGHIETQWDMPSSMVVGGGNNGFGGVAIPVGNAKQVEVFVCDKYKN